MAPFHPFDDAARHGALIPKPGAHVGEQHGVLAHLLGKDVAGAVERSLDVRNILLGADESDSLGFGIQSGVLEKLERQGLEPRLTRNGGKRAALRTVREIKVLESLLRVRGDDLRLKLGRELALVANAAENHLATLFKLAQITKAFLEKSKLRVVEAARHFL